MWDIKSVKTGSPDEVSKALKEGYEPFAVVAGMYSDTIWFRKEANLEVRDQQPKPVQKRHRRNPAKS
uniref:Uncharacterized protein n=1 Tax=viral metagenome TaxID=1070528 RepID=A0A6M3KAQ0_9ZZZZ